MLRLTRNTYSLASNQARLFLESALSYRYSESVLVRRFAISTESIHFRREETLLKNSRQSRIYRYANYSQANWTPARVDDQPRRRACDILVRIILLHYTLWILSHKVLIDVLPPSLGHVCVHRPIPIPLPTHHAFLISENTSCNVPCCGHAAFGIVAHFIPLPALSPPYSLREFANGGSRAFDGPLTLNTFCVWASGWMML